MRTLFLTVLATATAAGAAQAQTAPATPPSTAPAQPTTGQQANAPTAAGTATTPAAPTVGATIYGAGGQAVGRVDSVTPQGVVINTGTAKVAVPTAAVGTGPNGPTVSLTKEQLTAAAAQAQAAGAAAIAPGASVRSSDGATVVGTVKAVDDQYVTLTTSKGADVRLPKTGVANGPNGLAVGMTAAQFDAATAGAAPAAGSGSATATGDSAASGAAGNAAAGTGDTTASPSATSSTTTTKTKKTVKRR